MLTQPPQIGVSNGLGWVGKSVLYPKVCTTKSPRRGRRSAPETSAHRNPGPERPHRLLAESLGSYSSVIAGFVSFPWRDRMRQKCGKLIHTDTPGAGSKLRPPFIAVLLPHSDTTTLLSETLFVAFHWQGRVC